MNKVQYIISIPICEERMIYLLGSILIHVGCHVGDAVIHAVLQTRTEQIHS